MSGVCGAHPRRIRQVRLAPDRVAAHHAIGVQVRRPCDLRNAATIDEALRCKAEGREETILFGLTGTGYFDMKAYEAFNDGTMSDYEPTDEDLKRSFAKLPKI